MRDMNASDNVIRVDAADTVHIDVLSWGIYICVYCGC